MKTKNNKQSIDRFIEKLNFKLAVLLGKKGHIAATKARRSSNLFFVILIISSMLLLWLSTGFYYVGSGQGAIVFHNGVITDVLSGVKIGVTYPYPFTEIMLTDMDVSAPIVLSGDTVPGLEDGILMTDGKIVNVRAKFTYEVSDLKLFGLNLLQPQDDIDELVTNLVVTQLHNYIASNPSGKILNSSLIVRDNELRDLINKSIASFGLKIVSFDFTDIKVSEFKLTSNKGANKLALENELVNEARQYQVDMLSRARANVILFNTLLPDFEKDPDRVVNEVYNDLISSLPNASQSHGLNYPLLGLTLSQLILYKEKMVDSSNFTNTDEIRGLNRTRFTRQVDRTRDTSSRVMDDE